MKQGKTETEPHLHICYNVNPLKESKEKIAEILEIVHSARLDTPFEESPTIN
jgi:hypothetical protein